MMNYSMNQGRVLDFNQVMQKAPSVFAEMPSDKMSEKYLFVPTIQVVNQIMSQGFSITHASQSRSRLPDGKDFVRHMLRFRRNDLLEKQVLNVGDSVTELILTNSHNGSTAFSLALGLWRQVCSNGLMACNSIAGESVRHIGYSNDKILEAQFKVLDNEPKLIESYNRMSQVVLTDDERHILAESALQLRYDAEDTKPQVDQILRPRRYGDDKKDLWTSFNVIQENIIKGGLRTLSKNELGQVRRNRTRAVNSVSENTRLNQALWSLAEKMTELKAA